MNKKRHILLIGLMSFFLTGCINPARESTTTQISTEISTNVVLPSEKYKTSSYAERKTPMLSKNEIATIGVDSFQEEVLLSIPKLGINSELKLVCEENNEYDFSLLHEAPLWLCPEASPYLTDIGDYGASIILGHRQWGPERKVFADLDLMEKDDKISIKSIEHNLDFQVSNIIEVNPEELWQEIAKYHVTGEKQRKSFLILITCTPYGTDDMRLLVILERSNNE